MGFIKGDCASKSPGLFLVVFCFLLVSTWRFPGLGGWGGGVGGLGGGGTYVHWKRVKTSTKSPSLSPKQVLTNVFIVVIVKLRTVKAIAPPQLSVRLPLRASQVAGQNKLLCFSLTSKPRLRHHTHTHTLSHTHKTFSKPCRAKRAFYLGKTLKSQRKHDLCRGFSLSKTCCVFRTCAFSHMFGHVCRTVRFPTATKHTAPYKLSYLIIRGSVWEIPLLIFACVLFWGPRFPPDDPPAAVDDYLWGGIL